MSRIKGYNIILQRLVGSTYTTIACGQECTLSLNANTLEKASASSGTAREFVGGRTSWKISSSGILSTGDLATWKALIGTTLTISFQVRGTSEHLRGNVILKDFQVTGKIGSYSKYSMQFQGTGELS